MAGNEKNNNHIAADKAVNRLQINFSNAMRSINIISKKHFYPFEFSAAAIRVGNRTYKDDLMLQFMTMFFSVAKLLTLIFRFKNPG